MNFSFLKAIVISAFAMLVSVSAYADAASDFQTVCTNAWMKKADETKDKVDFKNFGEKYCGCAAKQPLGDDAAIQKAVHLCMSRTMLHDTMDSLGDEIGLSKIKDSDISDYCMNRWELIMPKQTDGEKKLINDYCNCVKPKLMELVKKSNNVTDKQYDETIDNVADGCADMALANKPSK